MEPEDYLGEEERKSIYQSLHFECSHVGFPGLSHKQAQTNQTTIAPHSILFYWTLTVSAFEIKFPETSWTLGELHENLPVKQYSLQQYQS